MYYTLTVAVHTGPFADRVSNIIVDAIVEMGVVVAFLVHITFTVGDIVTVVKILLLNRTLNNICIFPIIHIFLADPYAVQDNVGAYKWNAINIVESVHHP